MKIIRIVHKKFLRDDKFYWDISNESVNILGQYTVLEFDHKVFFGKINKHTTLYLMNDAIVSIEIKASENKKEVLLSK